MPGLERATCRRWRLLAALLPLLPAAAPAAGERGPEAAVAAIIAAARASILDAEGRLGRDPAAARAIIRDGILTHADLPLMARYVLGPSGRTASAAQRTRFTDALAAQITRIGAVALHDNAARALQLVKSTETELNLTRDTGGHAQVRMRLQGGPYAGLTIELWLHRGAERWRLFDAEVAGLGVLRIIHAGVQSAIERRGLDAVTRALAEGRGDPLAQ